MGYLLLPEASHQRLVGSALPVQLGLHQPGDPPGRQPADARRRVLLHDDLRRPRQPDPAPPFVPVQRGQDVIFGATLWHCFEDRCFGHVPWALLHAPLEPRRFWSGEIVRTASGSRHGEARPGLPRCRRARPGGRHAPARLRHLGASPQRPGFAAVRATSRPSRPTGSPAPRGAFAALLEERLERAGGAPDVLGERRRGATLTSCDAA